MRSFALLCSAGSLTEIVYTCDVSLITFSLLASGTAVALEDPIEPPTDPEPWIADYEGVEIDLASVPGR